MEEAAMRIRVTVLLIPFFLAFPALAQRTQPPATSSPREIDGVVRLEGRPAPPGILVTLDYAASQDSVPVATGELGRTMTDSSGKFRFNLVSLSGGGGRRPLFAVSARYAGFK